MTPAKVKVTKSGLKWQLTVPIDMAGVKELMFGVLPQRWMTGQLDNGWPAGQGNMTDYLDLCATHMDQLL